MSREFMERQETVLTEEQIQEGVQELASRLDERYRGKNPILVGVLDAAYIFLADLSRAMQTEHQVGFVKVRSYHEDRPLHRAEVHVQGDLHGAKGRDVVIVDTLADTGRTLRTVHEVYAHCSSPPRSLVTVSLLMRQGARLPPAEHICATILSVDAYLIGYGLDTHGQHRNLRRVVAAPTETISYR